MDRRKQAIQASQPVKAFEIERNDSREGGRAPRQELEAIAVAKVDEAVDALRVDELHDRRRRLRAFGGFQRGWRGGQNDDAGIRRRPEDRRVSRIGEGIDGEIAPPIVAGSTRSARSCPRLWRNRPQNPRHRPHYASAIPRRGQMR